MKQYIWRPWRANNLGGQNPDLGGQNLDLGGRDLKSQPPVGRGHVCMLEKTSARLALYACLAVVVLVVGSKRGNGMAAWFYAVAVVPPLEGTPEYAQKGCYQIIIMVVVVAVTMHFARTWRCICGVAFWLSSRSGNKCTTVAARESCQLLFCTLGSRQQLAANYLLVPLEHERLGLVPGRSVPRPSPRVHTWTASARRNQYCTAT